MPTEHYRLGEDGYEKFTPDRKLTQRQQQFVKAYMATGESEKSALSAGYTSSNSDVIAAQNLAKPAIQKSLAEVADKMGLTKERATGTIADKLKAKKVVIIEGKMYEVEDNASQLRAAELGLKIHGLRTEGESANIQVNVLSGGSWDSFMDSYHKTKENK